MTSQPPSHPLDRALLTAVQHGVPLVREPFAQLAAALDRPEQEVLDRLVFLRGDGAMIREVSGIFDAAALGYEQSLVALAVAEADLGRAGELVAAHPGVSHCYGRGHRYNLWFTLAVSPRSRLGLAATVQALAKAAAAESYLILPTVRRYKLDAKFGLEETDESEVPLADTPRAGEAPPPAPTERHIRAIRALQHELPLRRDPFASPAAAANLTPDELLEDARRFVAWGWLRRYAAVVFHRRSGALANVMTVWAVAPEQADAAGRQCAALAAVSHCYLRPTCPDWPFGLYAMVHGADAAACRQSIGRIAQATGLAAHEELWSLTEYKKRRVRLFTDDEAQWERAHT